MWGFVVGGAKVAEGAVPAAGVVEALNPLEDRRRELDTGVPGGAVEQFALHLDQNDSMSALSTLDATRPIEPSRPA